MKDIIEKIINGKEIEAICESVTLNIYKNGPNDITDLEILCYLCVYQTEIFEKYQDRILKYMGLSYKSILSESLPEVIFGMYSAHIKEKYHYEYTPVQASIVEGIQGNQCFSFSAPTSTGKSYVFRNIIMDSSKDIVIIVPSRALINEYFYTLCNLIEDKGVNILTFIDRINIKKAKRNVFIVTPDANCQGLFNQIHKKVTSSPPPHEADA